MIWTSWRLRPSSSWAPMAKGVTDWPVALASSAARWRGADAAVVGLGAGNGVFYVGLISALEPCAGVGSLNTALSRDDLWMN